MRTSFCRRLTRWFGNIGQHRVDARTPAGPFPCAIRACAAERFCVPYSRTACTSAERGSRSSPHPAQAWPALHLWREQRRGACKGRDACAQQTILPSIVADQDGLVRRHRRRHRRFDLQKFRNAAPRSSSYCSSAGNSRACSKSVCGRMANADDTPSGDVAEPELRNNFNKNGWRSRDP